MADNIVNIEKRTRVAKAKVTVEGMILSFAFANGEIEMFDTSTLTQELQHRAMLHGVEQKLRDCYAGAESAAEAQGLWQKVADSLNAGQWNVKGESGPLEGSLDLLAKAMVAAYAAKGVAKDATAIRVFLGTQDKAARTKLRNHPGIAVELAKLKTATQSDELPEIG